MQPGMKWISSRNKKSSPQAKVQMGFKPQMNPKGTSQPPKYQVKLYILLSSTMGDTRQGLWQIVLLPQIAWRRSTQVLCP